MGAKLPLGHARVFHKWVKCQLSHNKSWLRGW
jgi:hypothetical protein